MSPLFENIVLACIVAVVLFAGYHIAMHMIQQQAKQLVEKSGALPRTVSEIPGENQDLDRENKRSINEQPSGDRQPDKENREDTTYLPQPKPDDPQDKKDGPATFVTDLRQPENLFAKHTFLPETTDPALPAQNEGGEISAWDGDSAQPFSSF